MMDDARELRRRWRAFHEGRRAVWAAWENWTEADGMPPPNMPASAPMPAELRGLQCGARTRAGSPCKRSDIHLNGRCKLHGGLSTGPRSAEGVAKAKANLKRGAEPRGALTQVDLGSPPRTS